MHLHCSYFNNNLLIFGTLWEERALFSLLEIKSGPCPPSLQEAVEIVLTSVPSARRFKMTVVGRVCSLFCHLSCLLQEVACVFLSSGALMWYTEVLRMTFVRGFMWKWKWSHKVSEGVHVSVQKGLASDCYSASKQHCGNSLNIFVLCSFIFCSM